MSMNVVRGPAAKRIGVFIHIAVAAFIFQWPAFLSRGPAFNEDAFVYYQQADNIAARIINLPASFSHRSAGFGITQSSTPKQANSSSVMSRSMYYSLFIWASEKFGTLWLTIFFQGFFVSLLIYLVVRACQPARQTAIFYATVLTLSAISALPFIVVFTEPDIFAGVAVLSVFLMLIYHRSLSRSKKFGVWLVLAVSLSFHPANIIVFAVLGLALVAILPLIKPRRSFAFGTAGVIAAVISAALASWAYSETSKVSSGEARHAPPFLMARLLVDGPGRDYLRHSCAQGKKWTLCQFASHPLDHVYDILWSSSRIKGVFSISDVNTKLRLIQEQRPFVISAVLYEPGKELAKAAQNFVQQMFLFRLTEQVSPVSLQSLDVLKTRRAAPNGVRSPLPPWIIYFINAVDVSAVYVSVVFLVFQVVKICRKQEFAREMLETRDGHVLMIVAVLAVVLVANAAVCGILSDPVDRYQIRVIWLLPAAAIFAWLTTNVVDRNGAAKSTYSIRQNTLSAGTTGRRE